jgi:hypothetical protein
MHKTCNKTQRCKTRIWQPVQSHITAAAAKPLGSRLPPYRTRVQQAHQLTQDPLLDKPHTLNYTTPLFAAGPQTAHFKTQGVLEVHATASGAVVRPDGHNNCATQHNSRICSCPARTRCLHHSSYSAVQPHLLHLHIPKTTPAQSCGTYTTSSTLTRSHTHQCRQRTRTSTHFSQPA